MELTNNRPFTAPVIGVPKPETVAVVLPVPLVNSAPTKSDRFRDLCNGSSYTTANVHPAEFSVLSLFPCVPGTPKAVYVPGVVIKFVTLALRT